MNKYMFNHNKKESRLKFSRRDLLFSTAGMVLTGCTGSQSTKTDQANWVQPIISQISSNFFQKNKEATSPETISNLPYASILAKVGNTPWSLLILARIAGKKLHWVSSDSIVLVTRKGRLIRTVGLPNDLKHTRNIDQDPLDTQFQNSGEQSKVFWRMVDLAQNNLYGVMISSTFKPQEKTKIRNLNHDLEVIHIQEHCQGKNLNWNFVNHYWVGIDTGIVWRSSQHILPDSPPLDIKLMKRAIIS